MRRPILKHRVLKRFAFGVAVLIAVAAVLAQAYFARGIENSSAAPAAGAPRSADHSRPGADRVTLTDSQLHSIRLAVVENREFPTEKRAIGSIDFDEDQALPVYTPYQGRIIQAYPNLGDAVNKGQVLFTIESPDFIAAQSTLISAAATLDQTKSALARAKALYAVKGIDQNDYEAAVAAEQSAEGALRAARQGVAVFGRTEGEIDRIVATRHVDPALIVKSPIAGRITARNAAPGQLEQPGNPPAPYSVADVSTMWMLANVPEADIPEFKVGQAVSVSVTALPGRRFDGKITAIGATVDPNSRRVTLRSEIRDPKRELLAAMFATFVIRTGAPVSAPAVPLNGVVREGDGTMSVWVATKDPHRFTRRIVKVGAERDGYDEILDGVKSGETVAVDGAIFLSNILYGGAS